MIVVALNVVVCAWLKRGLDVEESCSTLQDLERNTVWFDPGSESAVFAPGTVLGRTVGNEVGPHAHRNGPCWPSKR